MAIIHQISKKKEYEISKISTTVTPEVVAKTTLKKNSTFISGL
jgi:hypothetical protein